jgi:hypothetical protein
VDVSGVTRVRHDEPELLVLAATDVQPVPGSTDLDEAGDALAAGLVGGPSFLGSNKPRNAARQIISLVLLGCAGAGVAVAWWRHRTRERLEQGWPT